MSAECMGWVYKFSPARGAALLVHLALADAANDLHNYEIWMYQATLAEKCRTTRRTVNTAMAWLVDQDLLEVLEESRRHTANRYRFLMPIAVPVWDPSSRPKVETVSDSGGLDEKPVQLGGKLVHTLGGLDEKPVHTELKERYTTQTEPKQTTHASTAVEPFDVFWKTYPRKSAKKEARKVWDKLSVSERSLAITGAETYRDDPNRLDEFTKHPATWLRAGCWDDDPLPSRTSSNNTRTHQPIEEWWDRSEPSGELDL